MDTLKECVDMLHSTLNLVFIEHESSYIGIYYKAIFGHCSLSILENYNELEDYWNYENYQNFNIVLSFSIEKGKRKERVELSVSLTKKLLYMGFKEVKSQELPTNN